MIPFRPFLAKKITQVTNHPVNRRGFFDTPAPLAEKPLVPQTKLLYTILGWTRTSNLRLRRPTLYPIELRGHRSNTKNHFPKNTSHCQVSIKHYTETLRQEVETALDSAAQFAADCPERLQEAVRYSLLAPGKRLRPILVLTACELCSKPEYRLKALPAACAVEMIHAYSLIHDDLPAMDNDDLRRGQPTCHRKFDEATAILAGDALLALAFEMIGNLTPPELAGQCCKELAVAAGACRLVGGQMEDMLREKMIGNAQSTVQAMEQVHHRKTGALMRVSLKLGGMIAGASEQQLTALDEYGKHFGLAFQITDDLLDVLGDEATVGKRLRKDAKMAKWSYPHFLGIEGAQQAAQKVVANAEKALSIFENNTLPFQALSDLVKQLPSRVS